MDAPCDSVFRPGGDWQERLAVILDTMREMSRQTDPQEMTRAYAARMERIVHRDRLVTLSRRGHRYPEFRVTRDSQQAEEINPWTERDRLPVLRGGLLAELIYSDEPRIIDDLRVDADDPCARYVEGQRSLMAIPLFDQEVALNMAIFLRRDTRAFCSEELPEFVWMSNLFGRATQNLVLSDELRRAYEAVDRELQTVADIQRSLLPARLPNIPSLDLAAHYRTSRRAGGDYYDLFPLSGGRWGILMADVSGHGTPAAVVMAITHAMAHTHPEEPCPPGKLLTRLNRQLTEIYTRGNGTFVTAFYGIYDPAQRTLAYANGGHNAPRLKRCADGSLFLLDAVGGLPLGINDDQRYEEFVQSLVTGDQIVFYTDGITEAFSPSGEMFGTSRLDAVLENCGVTAQGLIAEVLVALNAFQAGRPGDDDQTLLVAKVR